MDIDLYSYFYDLVKQIPKGMVTTYKELALALGDQIASRAVGQMLAENPTPIIVPCHRVIKSDGTLGGYNHPFGTNKKIELLESEGIKIKNGVVENFNEIIFKDFKTEFPLKKLRNDEQILKEKISLNDVNYDGIVAIDGSYNGRTIYLSFVKIDENLKILDIKNYKDIVNFPYIPTYFSYREGKEIIKFYDGNDLLLIDGNGIMHPRGFGLASFVGVIKNIPTIGIAKSHLFGDIFNDKILSGNAQIGWYIQNRYISPGSNISMESSFILIKKLFKKGDPIKLAHIYANRFMESEQQRQ
ncbi:MAG: endonuclease V [Thermoplasmata archaeon]|nr:endonuclease V [Thermoplasmata archaeon]